MWSIALHNNQSEMIMKRILKYIGFFILAIIVLFMVLAVLIVFLLLKSKSEGSTAHDSQHIIFEFGAGEMPIFEEPQLVYGKRLNFGRIVN